MDQHRASGPDPGDQRLPTTGMATGSDAGEAGEPPVNQPLDQADEALLNELERPGAEVVTDPVEESPAAAAAADDDAPLPLTDSAEAG